MCFEFGIYISEGKVIIFILSHNVNVECTV